MITFCSLPWKQEKEQLLSCWSNLRMTERPKLKVRKGTFSCLIYYVLLPTFFQCYNLQENKVVVVKMDAYTHWRIERKGEKLSRENLTVNVENIFSSHNNHLSKIEVKFQPVMTDLIQFFYYYLSSKVPNGVKILF